MDAVQAMIDQMSAQWQRDRSETQMTIGKLITALESMNPGDAIDGINEPHSYRGYYSDIAFENSGCKRTVKDTLKMCRGAIGRNFTGYKGGDYAMGESTPVWIADYGCCGMKIISIEESGKFGLMEDD